MKQLIILLPDEAVGKLHKIAQHRGEGMHDMLQALIYGLIAKEPTLFAYGDPADRYE